MECMVDMDIHHMVMDMVAATMEVVAITDLQTDPIDQDLNILSQDRTDQQQNRLDHLWGDLQRCQTDHQWVDLRVCR